MKKVSIQRQYHFERKFVKDCDVDIVRYLAKEGLLYHKEKYEHSYPHCWRCDSPLLYYAGESWLIRTTAIKDTFYKIMILLLGIRII